MQNKLFEVLEEVAGDSAGPRIDSTDLDSAISPGWEEASFAVANPNHRENAGGVVVRSSRSAIYGTQSSEFWIRNGLAAVNFSDLVRESSGHRVLPIDPGSDEDMFLLRQLSQALTAFVRLTKKSGQRFTGNRINDVGKRFEYMIAEELKKTPLDVSVLGRPGYPDCMRRQGERTSYLEIKTSGSIQKEAYRYLKTFSFSSGKRIKSDSRHLLLKVPLEEEDNKIWKVVAWELRDLSNLKTRLKTEFDAGFGDLEDVRLLGSSDNALQPLTVSVQSFLDSSNEATPQTRRHRRFGAGRTHPLG